MEQENKTLRIILVDLFVYFFVYLATSTYILFYTSPYYDEIVSVSVFPLAAVLVFPTLLTSLLLLFRFDGFKKYIALVVLNLVSLLPGLWLLLFFIIPGPLESLGFLLYFPAAFAVFLIFLIVEKLPRKFLQLGLIALIIFAIATTFIRLKNISDVVEQKVTLPDVARELNKRANINEQVNYCNTVKITGPRKDCFLGLYKGLLYNSKILNDITSENLKILCDSITRKDVENVNKLLGNVNKSVCNFK